MGELMLLLIMTLLKHLSAQKNDLPYFVDMTTWGLSMTEGSASSGLTGDPRDTTRAREARVQQSGRKGHALDQGKIRTLNSLMEEHAP